MLSVFSYLKFSSQTFFLLLKISNLAFMKKGKYKIHYLRIEKDLILL